MPQYYLTVPTSISLPADGSKVDLSAACELHRDDSALPNALAVDNGAYNVFAVSDPTQETAALPQVTATVAGTTTVGNTATSITLNSVDFGAAAAGLEALIFVSGTWNTAPASGDWSCTVGGNAATQIGFASPDRACTGLVFAISIPSGGVLNVVAQRSTGTSNFIAGTMMCLRVLGRSGIDTPVAPAANFTNNALIDVSQTVAAGSAVLAAWGARAPLASGGAGLTWVGVTQQVVRNDFGSPPSPLASAALATGLSAGTRTITAQTSGDTGGVGKAAISFELIP